MERARVLLLDAAPDEPLGRELERLLGHGLAVTLDLGRVADHAATQATWAGQVGFTDFDAFDESALIAETVRDRLGLRGGQVPRRRAAAGRVPGGRRPTPC